MTGTKRFEGRVALVTGAGRGIGQAIVMRLVDEGASVVLNDVLPRDQLDSVVETCAATGGTVRAVQGDITEVATRSRMIDTAMDTWGHIDIVVNNAYWEEVNAVGVISEAGWNRTWQVSVSGALFMIQAVIPHFVAQQHGVVVNVSSVHAQGASHRRVAYDTAKAALLSLTRSVACDYGPNGVRCNAVCPGLILADRNRDWWTAVPERLETVQWAYPQRRAGTMQEVASAVAFLASEDASFVNGTALVVDGGLNAMLAEVGLLDFARAQQPDGRL